MEKTKEIVRDVLRENLEEIKKCDEKLNEIFAKLPKSGVAERMAKNMKDQLSQMINSAELDEKPSEKKNRRTKKEPVFEDGTGKSENSAASKSKSAAEK